MWKVKQGRKSTRKMYKMTEYQSSLLRNSNEFERSRNIPIIHCITLMQMTYSNAKIHHRFDLTPVWTVNLIIYTSSHASREKNYKIRKMLWTKSSGLENRLQVEKHPLHLITMQDWSVVWRKNYHSSYNCYFL